MNISIIITAHNAAAYIVDTLDSIICQTYQNYEIVLVDDGSTDNTLNIMRDYAANHPPIKMNIITTRHLGRALALNCGVNFAKYDWIAIIDADDMWNKYKLELQAQCVVDYNLDFIATNSKLFFETSEIKTDEVIKFNSMLLPLSKVSMDKMLYFNMISHSSVLIKKSLVKYSLKRKSQIDYELFLRLLHNGAEIYLLNINLVYHRIHSGQSFEAKKHFLYALNATVLQLKYCLLCFKFRQVIFVILKLGYSILPRNLRFKIRKFGLAMINFKKS